MPGAVCTVTYPHSEGHHFDMEYYLKTHMPMVEKHWSQFGLKSWVVVELDKAAGYSVQAILQWDSVSSINTATQSEAAKVVFGDIEKFTNEKPLFLFGAEVKASQDFS